MMAIQQQDGKIGADRGSREIYQEIEETRSEMDQTLDDIGERLHPRHLIDEVVALFGSGESSGNSDSTERARMIGKSLIRKVKQHPVPALLCGGGLAWLLIEDGNHPRQPGMRRQWDDSDEHSGSFVDARTGAPYDSSYGEHWRGAAAWNHDFDWSDTHEDEPTWNERAERTLEEILSSLGDQQHAARDKIRLSASKLMTLSGRRRSEIHSQWDEIAEHSGSFVDARTGEPYDESYGDQWRALVCCDVAASEDWSEEDEQRLSDKAQESIARMQQAASDTTLSIKQRLRAVADQMSDFVSQSQEVSSRYGNKVRSKLSRAADASGRGISRVGRAGKRGAEATRQSAANGYQNVREATEEALENHPLAVGAAVLGAGLIGGLLLPRTQSEDRRMGAKSDRMKRQAGRAGQEAIERGQDVAQSAASAGMDEMERQGMTPQQVGEEVRDAGSRIKRVAQEKVPTAEQVRDKTQKVAERTADAAKQEGQRHADEVKARANSN